jgi:hypothetical protein
MRFVAICTICVTVLTLVFHGAFASSVDIAKQVDQVDQGLSYLSKREIATYDFETGTKRIPLKKKKQLYTILAKLLGSDAGCHITNSIPWYSTLNELPRFRCKKIDF